MTALASSAINGDFPNQAAPTVPSQSQPHSSPHGASRNLVICIDGSGNHYGPSQTNTNIVKLFRLLEQSTAKQICYYQPGIGAGEANGVNSLGVAIQKRVDFAIATHLEVQVTDAYKWLMNTYQDGDKIYMFGFSRGSYICRALAGMLQRVGLLGAGNFHNVPFAYRIFSKPRTSANDSLARGFKATFSREVHVEFIGVFDTVSSVGLFVPQTLPFTQGNTHVRVFRHAVSIDERRVRFQDNLWSGSLSEEEEINALGGRLDLREDLSLNHDLNLPADPEGTGQSREEEIKTDILEVWFAGTHSDVGGGWPDDPAPNPAALATLPGAPAAMTTSASAAGEQQVEGQGKGPYNLSIIPLKWMVRQALTHGVLFKSVPLSTLRPSYTIDPLAACATLHNTLPPGSIWWALEYIPQLTNTRSSTDAKQVYGLELHMGRARRIPEGARVHGSVRERRERMGYRPAGGWPEKVEWVE